MPTSTVLTLFYRYFRPIIDGGYLFIAQSPLYKVMRGKEVHYLYSDEEKIKLIGADNDEINEEGGEGEAEPTDAEAEVATKKNAAKWRVQRYKGLGEMNANELKETTMDKNNRVLKKVVIDDAIEADKVFDMLMGKDVPARKSFITTNAKLAEIDL